jgi:polyisoprenoid-binding protein YceI
VNAAGVQLYRIDAGQSEVRYEVGETFFNENNRFNLAIGRTRGVAGDVLVDFAQPSNSQIGEMVIDVSQFTSDQSRRDNFIRRNGLESSRYPQARFVTRSIEGLPAQVAVGDQVTFRISGDLTVKEMTRPVTWNVTLTLEDGRVVGSASAEILMSDFGVGPIRLATLLTEDLVKLFFDFVAMPVEG